MISATGTIRAITRAKRQARKVSGSAYGRPALAAMNPVDQSRTKTAGAAAVQPNEAGATEAGGESSRGIGSTVAKDSGGAGRAIELAPAWQSCTLGTSPP